MANPPPQSESSKGKRLIPLIWVGAGALVLIAGGVAAWYFGLLDFGFGKPASGHLNVWAPATVPYNPDCGANCKTFATLEAAHGGPKGAEGGLEMRYDPNVNDDVAQWGDCLDSVFVCINATGDRSPDRVRSCVQDAKCPKECKDRFAARASGSIDEVKAAFFGIFVDKDAACRPEGAG